MSKHNQRFGTICDPVFIAPPIPDPDPLTPEEIQSVADAVERAGLWFSDIPDMLGLRQAS